MAEYIKRKKLISKVETYLVNLDECDDLYYNVGKNDGLTEAIAVIKKTPAADVQEVKHGKWSKGMVSKEDSVFGDLHFGFQCSECGAILNKTPYCGNCGAKMDGEESEK